MLFKPFHVLDLIGVLDVRDSLIEADVITEQDVTKVIVCLVWVNQVVEKVQYDL